MSNAEKLGAVTGSVGSIKDGISKFRAARDPSLSDKDKSLQTISGVLDIASAVTSVLPGPASIVVGAMSGILGIFMPGAEGPGNQDVIDEISNTVNQGFKEQKEFIKGQFEEQKKFIRNQFRIAITKITDEMEETRQFISR